MLDFNRGVTTMQLRFVSAILADQTLEKLVLHAERIRYDRVEIRCRPTGKAERRSYSGLRNWSYQKPVSVKVEGRAHEGFLESRLLALRQSYNSLGDYIPQQEIST